VQRRVYAVQTQADPSAEFRDWIETDLLKLATADLRRVVINNYQIQEQFGMARIAPRETFELTRNSENEWLLGQRKPNDAVMSALTDALDNLKIVDVIPKPEFLTADLETKGQITPSMAAASFAAQASRSDIRTLASTSAFRAAAPSASERGCTARCTTASRFGRSTTGPRAAIAANRTASVGWSASATSSVVAGIRRSPVIAARSGSSAASAAASRRRISASASPAGRAATASRTAMV
jgi:hypothetical protein